MKRWPFYLILVLAAVMGCEKKDTNKESSSPSPEITTAKGTETANNQVQLPEMSFPLAKVNVEDLSLSSSKPRFLSNAKQAYRSEVKIDGASYDIIWADGNRRGLSVISHQDRDSIPRWWGADEQNAYHKIGDRYYQFAADIPNEQMIVRPFTGALGEFTLGAGGRTLEKMSMQGSLRAENASVAIGEKVEKNWPTACKSCRIPPGDYLPAYLSIEYGNLGISISNNYHSKADGPNYSNKKKIYGFSVRENNPYVLDFCNPPKVMFTMVSEGKKYRRGDELKVAAVLIDEELDFMVRRLNDNSRTQTKTYSSGTTREVPVSLDPKVYIKRSNGQIVAEGVMPFG